MWKLWARQVVAFQAKIYLLQQSSDIVWWYGTKKALKTHENNCNDINLYIIHQNSQSPWRNYFNTRNQELVYKKASQEFFAMYLPGCHDSYQRLTWV
jgi:hypothetical protein